MRWQDIYIQLQTVDCKVTIGLDDTLRPEDETCLSGDITQYLMEVGDSDGFITAGDKFMLYADNCRIDGIGTQLSWKPEDADGGFGAYFNTKCEYKVIEKASGKAIQSGIFVLQ